jgi:DmsE family decaheme c-type cytochrome
MPTFKPPASLLRRAIVSLAAIGLTLVTVLLVLACAPTLETTYTAGESVLGERLEALDALYVGEEVCLECHEHVDSHYTHTLHAKAFRQNPRGPEQRQVCEACHGPGSRHADETWNKDLIIGFTRNWETPVEVQNAACMSCHSGGERMHWSGSIHDRNEVACSDCHNPMVKASFQGALLAESISETCYSCHAQQRADFHKRSHMPLPEGKMSCVDCHNPHGSTARPLLKADSVNEVCYECHAEKRGPFLWEHAPVRENCSNCHLPHGSNHDKLLVTARPFLCQQCHNASIGHPGVFYNNSMTAASALLPGGLANARIIGRSCQNCHTQIHGSNHPSGARWQR